MGDGIAVDTAELRATASQIESLRFGGAEALAAGLTAPDALASTEAALRMLEANANYLAANQRYGEAASMRLAETLRLVADAYDQFDAVARRSLDGQGPPPDAVVPKANERPEPMPPMPPAASTPPPRDEALHVDVAQQRLSDGDNGGSLEHAKVTWQANGARLHLAAATFRIPVRNWEGEAAHEAYGKLAECGRWLTKLGHSWQKLAVEAHRLVDAHLKAIGDHTPVFEEYVALMANVGLGDQLTTLVEMEKLQHRSEEVRSIYANAAFPQRIDVESPPRGLGNAPTAVPGSGETRQRLSGSPDPHGGGRAGELSAGTAATPESPRRTVPLDGRAHPDAETGASATASGGATPLGGEPPAPDVWPGDGTQAARGGHDPRIADTNAPLGVHPAATGSGAAGAAGGRLSPLPLQPNVAGTSVGPPTLAAKAAGNPGPGAAASNGAMGAGGYGAPMHGQNQGRGKEKRRSPGLSPDQHVYVEEREHTEEVIGARKRRPLHDEKGMR